MTKDKKYTFNNVLIIINPASGKNTPILNTINDVFKEHKDINWDIAVTKKFGDANAFTKNGLNNYDLIAVYGGDGTVHEVINASIGSDTPIALLPGGTGNGFLTGLGIPHDLRKALQIIFKRKIKEVDVAKITRIAEQNKSDGKSKYASTNKIKELSGEFKYCISRMYTGIEENMQTSRQMKDKYGTFAYAINSFKQMKNVPVIDYTIEIDGKIIKEKAAKVYIANSGSTGTYVSMGNFSVSDGLLDVYTVSKNIKSILSTTKRMWNTNTSKETLHHWRGEKIKITSAKSQPVWVDGEPYGRTPIEVEVLKGAVKVMVG